MKTILTVLLAVVNVAFGVSIGNVENDINAARFYLLDDNCSLEECIRNEQ